MTAFRKLLHPAIIIADNPKWPVKTQVLGTGSVVQLLTAQRAPLSPYKKRKEVYVQWIDVANRAWSGWLSEKSKLRDTKNTKVSNKRDEVEPLKPWDLRREKFMNATKASTPTIHEEISAMKKSKKGTAAKGSSKSDRTVTKKGKKSGKTSAPRGSGEFAGKVLIPLVDENPRREGSAGYDNWKLIKKGMTFEQYVEKGGEVGKLRTEIARGNLKVKARKTA